MIKFEKVSLEQFTKDLRKVSMPWVTDEEAKDIYDKIKLPKRGSTGSAGYDFYTPISFTLEWDATVTIPTGVRAIMPQNMLLNIVPRSGIGFKSGTSLANTIGIIDSDYYYSDNEGHIMIKLVTGFDTLAAEAGDRFVQGIFTKYYITDDDDATEVRKGGLGSTGA